MPLFFFISGCTRALSCKVANNIEILIKTILSKFCLLIIPSIVWTMFIPMFFSTNMKFDFTNISGYWFLNVLIVIILLWESFLYVENKNICNKLLYTVVILGIILAFILDLKRISLAYFSMYILGFYYQKYKFLNRINNYIYAFLFIAFCVISPYYEYGSSTLGDSDRVWLLVPVSLCASLSSIKIFSYFEYYYKQKLGILSYIGKHTLGIYLSHFIFVNLSFVSLIEKNLPDIYQFIFLFFLSLIISLICIIFEEIIKAIPILYRIMYGRKI